MIIFSSPVRAADRLEIWPRISFGEMLTDNLIQQSSKSSNGGDAISVIALGGTATVDSNKRNFSLDYVTDAEIYARHSSLDEALQNQYVGLRDSERLSGATNMYIDDTFFNGQQRFAQSLVLGSSVATPLVTQALVQNSYLTNGFNLQLDHRFNDRFSALASVHQTFFETSGGQTAESFQQGGELTAYYKVYPNLFVGPSFEFNDMRFSNRGRADSYQPSLAVIWNATEHLTTSATAGPLIMSTASQTSVTAGYTLSSVYTGERWQFQFYSGRTPSISAGNSGSSVNQYEGAGAGYALSRYTDVFINGAFSQFTQTTSDYYSIVYGGGIIHELTRTISIAAEFIRFQTNSHSVNGNATDTLMLSIKYSPRPWVWAF